MKVVVFGLWHQGCVTSACLAKLGHQVIGLDFDKNVVGSLQKAQAPLFEPELNELISQQLKEGHLSFTMDASKALAKTELLWFAFDTPVNDKDVADIKFLRKNFRKIMPYLKDGTAILVTSQAPAGFVGQIQKELAKAHPKKKFHMAYSPENLRLGKALQAFLNPDRIVIGIDNQESKKVFETLFSSITDRLEWMGIESAEMTKHAINAFLALSVCLANELAGICEQTGADVKELERGLKTESRIGPKAYLKPGAAYAGGTLARDINFLIGLSDRFKLPAHLIRSVNISNAFHKTWIERQCHSLLKSFKNKTVAILGLTYKPQTDTLRRSWAVELAKYFHTKGALVKGFDPVIKSIPNSLAKIINLEPTIEATVQMADVIIIAVEWPEFREMSEHTIELLKNKIVIDPNGFIEELMAHKQLNYVAVGRGSKK